MKIRVSKNFMVDQLYGEGIPNFLAKIVDFARTHNIPNDATFMLAYDTINFSWEREETGAERAHRELQTVRQAVVQEAQERRTLALLLAKYAEPALEENENV